MSVRDGLNFDDILSEVAGAGVDIGKGEIEQKEGDAGGVEVAKVVPEIKEENKATRKRKKHIPQKVKTGRNNRDYSCTKIKKRFVSLIRILYPDMYVHEGVEKVFEEWERNNRKKIQEAKKNL